VDPAAKLASWEDILALPEGERGEIVDGVLLVPPRPLPRHSRAQVGLGREIGGPFDADDGRGGPGGWWILFEVDVRFAQHRIVHPDVAGWRRERLPDPWDLRPIDVTPDWVCEVISSKNAAHDRVVKRRLYAEHGVPFYWLVDPEERILEALRLDEATRAWIELGAFGPDASARIPPFEAIELDTSRLFPP
jgi:Uma2 family endonuclease